MTPVRLIFCLHNHQPVGNFDYVNEGAFQLAYKPYLDLVGEYPDFKFCLHTSGCLLEWIEKHHPEYLERLGELVDRGQVELLTGAMYEPILPIWPDPMIKSQVKRQTGWLHDRFGTHPRGFWLAERVWEPHLASVLNKAGVRYLPLDDSLFKAAGIDTDRRDGYVEAVHEGNAIAVFPVAERLRYTIPFKPPVDSLKYLASCARRHDGAIVTYADDGEKFGSWPGTHRWVYKRGWLRRFIEAVLERPDLVELTHFRDVVRDTKPSRRITLPAGSYREMIEWAEGRSSSRRLPAVGRRATHNPWRNFLERYAEVERLYRTVRAFSNSVRPARRPGKQSQAEAAAHLDRAQCNCAYWHGVFGGLYLPHLRSALYEELGRARALGRRGSPRVTALPHGKTSPEEVYVAHSDFDLRVDPQHGGTLDLILQHRPAFNWGCTLTRRLEPFHPKPDPGRRVRRSRAATLYYDQYDRASLMDHFLEPGATLRAFTESGTRELGTFVAAPYRVTTSDGSVTLERHGLLLPASRRIPVTIAKNITPHPTQPRFTVAYKLDIERPFAGVFGVEWNLTALGPTGPDRWIEVDREQAGDPKGQARHREIGSFGLVDQWGRRAIHIGADRTFDLWRFGLFTHSRSQKGLERIYQQTVFLARFQLSGESSLAFAFDVELRAL